MGLFDWFSSPGASDPKPSNSGLDILNMVKDTISTVTDITSKVIDSGLNTYETFAEKIARVRLMNSEISSRLSVDAAAQAQQVAVENFFKTYGGILAGGAIGALFLGLLLTRK